MKKAIIGKKVGMTQIFDEMGKVIPVTVIEAGPCVVVQKMTNEKEGYHAVQLGFEEVGDKKLSKPEQGHLKKAGVGMMKHLKEFRLEDDSNLEVGDVIKADFFTEGEKVDAELNLIAIRGAVPGPKGSIVYLKDTVKTQPVKKGAAAGVSVNPQKASARTK